VIRREAGMSTVRFCRMLQIPERTYRRWQQRERDGRPARGPWPTPAQDRVGPAAVKAADEWPAWGALTIGMFLREEQIVPDASLSTVYRALKRAGRVHERDHTTVLRQHAQARRAAFLVPPDGPLQVWQMDFSEFETRWGGTWRIGGVADYWSKVEFGFHVSPTQNQHDAITAVKLALAETERLLDGQSLLEHLTHPATGEIRPICLVTDNGPCFKAGGFARFIASRPELVHIRTRVKSPGQNGVRERGFLSLKYQQLYRHDIHDGHELAEQIESYRQVFNEIRPHHSLAGKRPLHVHQNPDLHPDRAHPASTDAAEATGAVLRASETPDHIPAPPERSALTPSLTTS
jgi:transposase InsO family protein